MSKQYSHQPVPIAEVKAAGDGSWEVDGYISTFGNRDRGGDIILPGAFDKSLARWQEIRFLFAHDQSKILGVPLELKADDHGLFGRFKISRTRLGEETHTLIKDGALDKFSIGFFIDDLAWDDESDSRLLKDIDLLEASLVAVPMNEEARVTSFKQATQSVLRFDEHAEFVTTTLKSFMDRCSDYAALRARDGRKPSAAFFERLNAVRAATDELLSIKAPEPVVSAEIAEKVVTRTVDALLDVLDPDGKGAPPPDDPAPRSDLSTRLALRRAKLRHAGILETSPHEHDRRRGQV